MNIPQTNVYSGGTACSVSRTIISFKREIKIIELVKLPFLVQFVP